MSAHSVFSDILIPKCQYSLCNDRGIKKFNNLFVIHVVNKEINSIFFIKYKLKLEHKTNIYAFVVGTINMMVSRQV